MSCNLAVPFLNKFPKENLVHSYEKSLGKNVHNSTKIMNEEMVLTIKFRRGKKENRFRSKTDNQGIPR